MTKEELTAAQAFDSYIKKVIKGAARNGYKKSKLRFEREIFHSEMTFKELSDLNAFDRYFNSYDYFVVQEHLVSVDNPMLAAAIRELRDGYWEIVIMYYFLRMKEQEIADAMNLAVSTVCTRKKKSITKLRVILEETVDG